MPSNAELTPLEQGMIHYVKTYGPVTNQNIQLNFMYFTRSVVDQALSDLIAAGYIIGSHDTPIRYEISRLEDDNGR